MGGGDVERRVVVDALRVAERRVPDEAVRGFVAGRGTAGRLIVAAGFVVTVGVV